MGCDDGTIRLWDMPEANERAVLEAHVDIVRSISFSPDGRRLVSTSQDRLVMLWDAASGVAVRPLGVEVKGPNPVRFAAFSPDGTYVAVGEVAGSASEVILLDPRPVRLRQSADGSRRRDQCDWCSRRTAARWQPRASTGVSSSGIWPRPRNSRRIRDGVGFIKALAFSRDGDWLAFAGSDDTVKIWDMKCRKSIAGRVSSAPGPIVAWRGDRRRCASWP